MGGSAEGRACVSGVVGAGMTQAKTTLLVAWKEQLRLGWGQM